MPKPGKLERDLQSAEVSQTLIQQIVAGKQHRMFVIVLSPIVQIPIELEKHFIVVEHELSSRAQLQELAQGFATEDGELPQAAQLEAVLDAAAGLTRYGRVGLQPVLRRCLQIA